MPKLRILLVDDHEVVRLGLKALLGRQEGFEVVGEAANGLEAVEKYKELQPDFVTMETTACP